MHFVKEDLISAVSRCRGPATSRCGLELRSLKLRPQPLGLASVLMWRKFAETRTGTSGLKRDLRRWAETRYNTPFRRAG
jgi:hypothetical protein